MKKLMLAAFAALSTLCSAHAQLSVGLRAGVTGTTVASPVGYDSENQVGGVVGAFVHFGNRFYVQSGFDYYGNQTGLQSDQSGEMTDFDFTSFNIPLWVGYRFGEDALNIRLFGGGNVNIISQTESNSLNLVEDDLESVQGLWVIGIGGDVRKFTLDFTYERGVDEFILKDDIGGRLTRFTATVGYRIL